uniref:Uncharacterized protein n=1 Tax=Amphimedon queenslandica TaxID=400682 RepID=A0A1X7UEJ9_AMPQE
MEYSQLGIVLWLLTNCLNKSATSNHRTASVILAWPS